MSSKAQQIKEACQQFLSSLGEFAADDAVFVVLQRAAEARGLELRAHQRGINGTFVHFAKRED